MLIAFAGLPGSGKSTIAKMLAAELNVRVFSEPEEDHWPELIHNRDKYGHFTGLSWFRFIRVEQLYDAKEQATATGYSIVDSYYDVLIHHYLGHPDFHWLIKPSDPYFPVAEAMTSVDYANLPKADVLVFLSVEIDTWQKMLAKRGRRLDNDDNLKDEFGMQKAIRDACLSTANDHRCKLIEVAQCWKQPEGTMRAIVSELFG